MKMSLFVFLVDVYCETELCFSLLKISVVQGLYPKCEISLFLSRWCKIVG